MNYKKFIIDLIPYGLVKKIRVKKKKKNSIELFLTEKDNNLYPFQGDKMIISVQGFGYSGSGAVLDLLREYRGVCVWGDYEVENTASVGLKTIKEAPFEMDLLRHAGGLFEIEKIINQNSIFVNDAAIKRLIRYIDSFISKQKESSIFKGKEFKMYASSFLNSLIDQRLATGKEYPFNPHLKHIGDYDDNYVYFLKQMTVNEYRNLCASFLRNIFSLVDVDTIVLDQLLMDGELDYERNKAYLPNHKIIMVYRDPRDVFATCIIKNILWMPHSGDEFVKWYKKMHRIMDKIDKYEDAICIQFEKLILDYDSEIKRIESFINLSDKEHLMKKWFFDPSISQKNIGLYTQLNQSFSGDIKIIERALSKYCYNGR